MRKISLLIACLVFIAGACNKNKKLNKSIEGNWITTSINGFQVTMADDPVQYKFSKSDKDGGTVSITYFDNYKVDSEFSGTYKISDKGKKITIDAHGVNGSSSEPDIHVVDDISNKEDKKYTPTEINSEAATGYTGVDSFVLEKQ